MATSTNGGLYRFADRKTSHFRAHAFPQPRTVQRVIKQGQRLKGRTWLMADPYDLTLVPYVNIAETTRFTAASGVWGSTVLSVGDVAELGVVGGGGGSQPTVVYDITAVEAITYAELWEVLANLENGDLPILSKVTVTTNPTSLPVQSPITIEVDPNDAHTLVVTSTQVGKNMGLISLVKNPTMIPSLIGNPTNFDGVTAISVAGFNPPLAGLLLYDIDTTTVQKEAAIEVSGSYWSDGVLWRYLPTDTIENPDDVDNPLPVQCQGLGAVVTSLFPQYETGCTEPVHFNYFVQGYEFDIVHERLGEKSI